MSCLYSPVDGYFVFAFWYWFLIVKLSYRSSSFDILFKSLASCNNTFSFPLIIEMMLSALYMIYLPNVCLWHTFWCLGGKPHSNMTLFVVFLFHFLLKCLFGQTNLKKKKSVSHSAYFQVRSPLLFDGVMTGVLIFEDMINFIWTFFDDLQIEPKFIYIHNSVNFEVLIFRLKKKCLCARCMKLCQLMVPLKVYVLIYTSHY